MSFSSRDWSAAYEKTKRIIQNRRQENKTIVGSEKENVSSCIDRLDSQLKMMKSAPMQYEIVGSEVARREVLLRNLRTHLAKASLPSRPGTSAGRATASASSSGGIGNPLHLDETRSSSNSTNSAGLALRQDQVIKQQDLMLEEISEGVSRLKDKAQVINNEVNLQGKLLEDLEDNVEIGIVGLQDEAEHAKVVREKSRVFYMYVCILVEFIILMLLIFIAFVH